MKSRAREWRQGLVLAGVSTVFGLALAEGAARMLFRPTKASSGTPISELSPTLGWRVRAGGSQRIRREDFEVTVSINAMGLRGPEVPHEPGPGVRRLAIMGDSFAHGYYAEEPETLRGRLAAALRSCRIDVINAGSPGYSTDQEWLYFGEEVARYRPLEVLLLFYSNDLHFNLERIGTANRSKPVFEEKGGALEMLPPVLTRQSPAVEAERPDEPRAAVRFKESALWAYAAARLQRRRPDWAGALSRYGLAPRLSAEPPAEYIPFGPKGRREESRVDEMWRRTAEILRRFRDDVREKGAGLSVFYVPTRFEANDEAWTYLIRRYEADRRWERDAVRSRLTRVLASLGIPLVEATVAFRTAEKTENPAYLPVDGHWNARGNEIAFEAVLPPMRSTLGCGS